VAVVRATVQRDAHNDTLIVSPFELKVTRCNSADGEPWGYTPVYCSPFVALPKHVTLI